MDTLGHLRDIFGSFFDQEFESFGETMSPADLEKWDSTAHVGLVLEIERHFDIEFTPSELGRLISVGAIRDLVDRKRTA